MAAPRKKSIEDIPVAGRRALVRVDFNVPMNAGEITDDLRIQGRPENDKPPACRRCDRDIDVALGPARR